MGKNEKKNVTTLITIHVFYCIFAFYWCMKEIIGARGGVEVKTLRYKPAGRGFDSRWFYWNFSVT